MKKTLLLGITLLGGLFANAQIADGSMAPDFTATDINGNVHTLSEYLAEGKTVILDISATWCGPCWNFHNSHVLDKFYKTYGEEGSDDVVVLFVEGDASTTDADLHGTGTNTWGDWTAGSDYAIIDDASISALYQLEFFPTVMRICPDGLVKLMPNTTAGLSFTGIENNINADCGQLATVDNHAEIASTDIRICNVDVKGKAITSFTNYGTNAITSATINFKEDGNIIATQTFSGSVARYAKSADINFEGLTINEEASHTVEVMDINANAPYNTDLLSQDISVAGTSSDTGNNIRVDVHTDNYPGEISFKIWDSNGQVVFTSPAYQPGTGEAGAGGADANTTKTHYISLPEGTECYSFELLDEYGDGWSLGNTEHGITVYTNGQEEAVTTIEAGNFGKSLLQINTLSTTGVLATPTIEAEAFSIYPNPSNGVFNFATPETVDVTILDLTGKVVYSAKGIEDGASINLSSLQSGMYIAQIKGEKAQRIEKLVIK